MFGWIRRLMGIDKPLPVKKEKPTVVDSADVVKPKPKAKPKPKVPAFAKMTKLEIETWARENHGIELDRRFKKDTMIKTLKQKLREKK